MKPLFDPSAITTLSLLLLTEVGILLAKGQLKLTWLVGYRAFAYRIDFAARLVNPGGPIDSLFPFSATAAVQFTSELYSSGLAGSFHANYFYTNLVARGLHNPNSGPAFKHFPFFEDASVIHRALQDFMTKFVNSY